MLLLLLGERRIAIYWNYFQFHFKELHVKAVAMFLVLCDWEIDVFLVDGEVLGLLPVGSALKSRG